MGEPWAIPGPVISGHECVRGLAEALARHLISDLIRGAIFPPRALEDLREPRGDGLNIGDDLRLAHPALVLARDADDAAGIDDVIGCIEDASGLQRCAVPILRELVVGGPG